MKNLLIAFGSFLLILLIIFFLFFKKLTLFEDISNYFKPHISGVYRCVGDSTSYMDFKDKNFVEISMWGLAKGSGKYEDGDKYVKFEDGMVYEKHGDTLCSPSIMGIQFKFIKTK